MAQKIRETKTKHFDNNAKNNYAENADCEKALQKAVTKVFTS